MHTILHVQLLGDFRLVYGDEPVTRVNTARLRTLLAFLVLHRDTPQARQHLAFLFWADSTEAQARNNLRQALHQLRHALPAADRFLYADVTTVCWQSDAAFSLDVADFANALAMADQAEHSTDQAAARAALEQAVSLYRGDLLPSCYDEWIAPERERLREQHQNALARLVRLLEEQREYTAAIHYAQRLLRHDPLDEASYLCLIRLHSLNHDRAGALRVYHACATVLQRELGVEPSPAIHEVYERLLRVQAQPAVARVPTLAEASPLIGRQSEWEQLQAAWQRAIGGRAHFTLVTGEAGIGKSRLAEELFAWASQQDFATAKTRAYAAEGRLSYGSVTEWLRSEPLRAGRASLDPVWLSEMARLLPELLVERPDLPHPQPLTEYWQRQRFFEAMARAVLQATQPLLLLFDDLQWCDQETLEWLHYLLRFDPQAQFLVVGTARAEEVGAQHPLTTLLYDLQRTEQVMEIMLGPLNAADAGRLTAHIAGQELDVDQLRELYRETEGNPLFVVEMARAGVDRRLEIANRSLTAQRRSPTSHLQSLPPRMHAVIAARLAQLSAPARQLASLAATNGRAFTFDVLARASDDDEDSLVRALDELWQRRIVREQGANTYDFSHDKLREVAYAEVSPMHRQLMHRRVARALEAVFASDLDPVSGQIAAHYEQAGRPNQAIEYYRRAAAVAQHVYAHEEAINLFTRALDLLERLPNSAQSAAEELSLRLALAVSIRVTKGWAARELRPVLGRAWELSQQVGEPAQRFLVLVGLSADYIVRGEIQRGHDLALQLLELAQQIDAPPLLVIAHSTLAGNHLLFGNQPLARQYFARARELYDPQRHHQEHAILFGPDYGVLTLCWGAHNLWCLGYTDQARQWSHEALALAQELAHPFSQSMAMTYATMLSLWCGEIEAAQEHAAAALAQATQHNATYYQRWATILYAWIQARRRSGEDEIVRLRQALADFRAIDAGMRWPYYLSLLAQIHAQAGQPDEAIAVLDEAQATSATTQEHWWDAELHCLRGELLLMQGADERDVVTTFQQALEIARQQQAKSLELRTTVSLARLWQNQARHAEARQMLAEVYGWFSEGFDTHDLQEARALLEQL
jgi:DNA-binding SARP family transcriptional activator/predicted ATPase